MRGLFCVDGREGSPCRHWKLKHAHPAHLQQCLRAWLWLEDSCSALQVPEGKNGRHLFICASSVMGCNHFGVGKSPFLHLSKPCHLWPVRPCAASVGLSFLHELNRCIRWSPGFLIMKFLFFFFPLPRQPGILLHRSGRTVRIFCRPTFPADRCKKQQHHGPLGSLY